MSACAYSAMELPSRIAGLFAYTDELGGCVAVNARHPRERRRWTLAHEYGHFLTTRYQSEISPSSAPMTASLPASGWPMPSQAVS